MLASAVFPPLLLTERLCAFAVFLQTVEMFQIRDSFSECGIWRWSTLKREFSSASTPVRKVLDVIFSTPNFYILLAFRLMVSFYALFYTSSIALLFLLISSVLICVRWRGTFNGGSDYMSILVLLVLVLATSFAAYPSVGLACVYYLGIQTVMSYFLAGVAKCKRKNWRNGTALEGFLASDTYQAAFLERWMPLSPKALVACSWLTIIFELSFPLALLSPHVCLMFIALGLLFHIAIAYAFGLNRFLFAWAAAYPCLYYSSLLLQF